jgi:hypothetical protein
VASGPQSDSATKVASIFGFLADRDFHGYSPLYEHLARQVAHDDVIPEIVARGSGRNHAPVLFFACVHDIVLREPELDIARFYADAMSGLDPGNTQVWKSFRQLVLDRADEIETMMSTRSVQTNEVGRSAAIRPALAALAALDERPIGLIELGTSAGLNLLFDRYRIEYAPLGAVGPEDAPVQLHCELRGTRRLPLTDAGPVIVSRLGVDRSPVDVRDDDAIRWLRACIWPDASRRTERFDAAVALARQDPPQLWAGDLLDLLEEAVALVPEEAIACLVSTWVLAYLRLEQRKELHERVLAIAARRPLAYVTAEYEIIAPWLDRAARQPSHDSGELPTRLAVALWDHDRVETRDLAWMHAHGTWIEWLDEGGGPIPPTGTAAP